MLALLAATLIWSLSFGIIQDYLPGVPGELVTLYRLGIAAVVFAPFAWRARRGNQLRLDLGGLLPKGRLAVVGTVQFGLMYWLYHTSYVHLRAWEVALFTVTTPIWVGVLEHFTRHRRPGFKARRHGLSTSAWLSVFICVAGAGVVRWSTAGTSEWTSTRQLLVGFALVQAANLCFAWGQVAYRRLGRGRLPTPDAAAHFWMYLGALGFALLVAVLRVPFDEWAQLQLPAWQALAYLGIVASGFGFFLWNSGARRVTPAVLANLNNLKVPSAVLVSLIFFSGLVPSAEVWLGMALVVLSIAYSVRKAH